MLLLLFLFGSLLEVNGVKIGIICDTRSSNWQYLFKDAGAINVAIDKLISNGIIQNDTIER